jgi:hypothetical protein
VTSNHTGPSIFQFLILDNLLNTCSGLRSSDWLAPDACYFFFVVFSFCLAIVYIISALLIHFLDAPPIFFVSVFVCQVHDTIGRGVANTKQIRKEAKRN